MANPEHLEILKQGVAVWNAYRRQSNSVSMDFRRAYLEGYDLREAYLSGADFSRANLRHADLRGAYLAGSDLRYANLSSADCRGVTLAEADVCRAILQRTHLVGADLRQADLSGAELVGADLRVVNFTHANLNDTDLSLAILDETIFADTDLDGAKHLDQCKHYGASTLEHRTLARNPSLPIVFLRGCGLSEMEIEFFKLYRKDLSEGQITDITYRIHKLRSVGVFEYHSCFISYASENEDFARRLHNDLQESGIRCWFAPEDMKTGDRLRYAIDQAIHLQDQLLLILSEHAVASPWVEQEVETALEKEDQEGRTVLLPIRIDQAVMESQYGWAAHLRRTRLIGDFCGWNDRDKYSAAFERLLKDLRATG